MAKHDSTDAPMRMTDGQADERPLIVIIDPHGLGFSAYEGSRAQLEEEGILPSGTEWPTGRVRTHWEQGTFEFSLFRTRPEGMKGPMKLWTEGDYWQLRWELKERPDRGTLAIRKKEAELKQEVYHQSLDGKLARDTFWRLYCKARGDDGFQTFKSAIIPQRKNPGRPRKQAT